MDDPPGEPVVIHKSEAVARHGSHRQQDARRWCDRVTDPLLPSEAP
jgi:hypothetical protein